MDGISSANTVVQRIAAVYDVSNSLRSPHDAPKGVLEIAETLDQLQQDLADV